LRHLVYPPCQLSWRIIDSAQPLYAIADINSKAGDRVHRAPVENYPRSIRGAKCAASELPAISLRLCCYTASVDYRQIGFVESIRNLYRSRVEMPQDLGAVRLI
jgi:hypothetical protein